jgi:hypothetical protein
MNYFDAKCETDFRKHQNRLGPVTLLLTPPEVGGTEWNGRVPNSAPNGHRVNRAANSTGQDPGNIMEIPPVSLSLTIHGGERDVSPVKPPSPNGSSRPRCAATARLQLRIGPAPAAGRDDPFLPWLNKAVAQTTA